MTPNDIYQALKNRNLNVAMIAESLGVSNQAVSNVIKQGKNSQRIAKAISIAIDQPLDHVFPYYAKSQHKKIVRAEKVLQLRQQFAQI
ncbi:DNA-binding protein [Rodentibacter pneumotropicus]|uniref:helix-turn-helix domain-containing protein n=1 Tax=Rodentibacter pneumotropicus TaxID=758 RepID=UPI0009896B73|nr:helix-turn-helix transcriptional regulator [Rodentibacter pneumotropicus]OOF65190.1 DNA-binding protein [Rodentibacter pneumotropicus]